MEKYEAESLLNCVMTGNFHRISNQEEQNVDMLRLTCESLGKLYILDSVPGARHCKKGQDLKMNL